ncbi:MAG: pentapeptide repeat-containing protein [Streptosporangiaceae bacterium]
MSANDVLTLVIAVAAVAVPLAALLISNRVDQRASRSALTDLALKISDRTTAYDDLPAGKRFPPSREIEMLVLQAEYLMQRLTTRARKRALFPESAVATTMAMALDKVNDFWWSDQYWPKAAATADAYFHALICSYWGEALIRRGAVTEGRKVVRGALDALPSATADTCIVKGDICLGLTEWDNDEAGAWVASARAEYESIPAGARLTDADLTGASLAGAVLTGADLTGAIIGPDDEPPEGWTGDPGSGRLRRASFVPNE